MIRYRVISLLAAALVPGCAAYIPVEMTSDNPKYQPARPSCIVPERIKGMKRIRPTDEQVTAVWSLLDFPDATYIEYWFEDNAGIAQIGISDGSRHWSVDLFHLDGKYEIKGNGDDWTLELICVG